MVSSLLAPSAARAEDADVVVEVSPRHLVLGADDGAVVTIRAEGDVSDVKLFSNVGRVAAVEDAGGGVYRARLSPPEEFYPHVAVLVAVVNVSGERRVGFTTLPLWGQGALEASGEPGADLVVTIGGRTYGPEKAGDDGLASIPIQVAPGETEAVTGGEKLPLGLVDFPRVVGVFVDEEPRSHPHLEVTSELRLFVTDSSGAPEKSPQLRLDVVRGKGSVGVPVVLAPGVVAATVRVAAGAQGPLEVRWRLQGSAASSGSVVVEVESAPPLAAELAGFGEDGDGALMDLKVDAPASLVLGRDQSAPLVVTLPRGATASDLRLYASVGRVSSLKDAGEGRYLATYTAPGEEHAQVALFAAVADIDGVPHVGLGRLPLHGQQTVRVRGKARGAVTVDIGGQTFGPVKADRKGFARVPVVVPPGVSFGTSGGNRVTLTERPFPRLLVVPLAPRAFSDGDSEVPVRLYAMTPAGGAFSDAAVSLDVDRGQLSPAEPVGKGLFVARFRAPPENGEVRFVAALEGDPASTTTLLLPVVPRRASSAVVAAIPPPRGSDGAADEDDRAVVTADVGSSSREHKLLLLGAHAGFASNFIAMYAPFGAIDATLQGSGLLDGGMLQLELGSLYQPGESQVSEGPLAGTTYSRHLVAIPVLVTGGWRLRFGDLSFAAGLGAKADWVYSAVGDYNEQFFSFGPVAHLAGAYRLGPGEVVVKARYSYGGLEGGFGAATLLCGYAVEVF